MVEEIDGVLACGRVDSGAHRRDVGAETEELPNTVWFFSYDFPENCTAGDGNEGTRCTHADFLTPGTFASIMWGRSGHFVTGSAATFQGSRPRNTSPCITEPAVVDENCSGVLLGHGLHNPQSAEIHFVLRDHGPDQEGIEDETSTIQRRLRPGDAPRAPGVRSGLGNARELRLLRPAGQQLKTGGQGAAPRAAPCLRPDGPSSPHAQAGPHAEEARRWPKA